MKVAYVLLCLSLVFAQGAWTLPADDPTSDEEFIMIDEGKNVEIFRTESLEVVKDFELGVECIMPIRDDSCYVRKLDETKSTPPQELKLYLESGESTVDVEDDEADFVGNYATIGDPIDDPSVVGDTIAEECEGRKIYLVERVKLGGTGRTKRALCTRCRVEDGNRVCEEYPCRTCFRCQMDDQGSRTCREFHC
ncbi:uncharacterized protein [Ptychodera flava]|uniref:uncharacterized protein n=1 Tax=Ptychodera flava TaxID=63121 RepID=UPI003969C59F